MKYLLLTLLLLSSALDAYQTATIRAKHSQTIQIKFGCYTYRNGCTYFYNDETCRQMSYMVCGDYSVTFHGEQ